MDKSGSAFPFQEKNDDGTHHFSHPGLSRREYFAATALSGLLANNSIHEQQIEHCTTLAFLYADAMIEASK